MPRHLWKKMRASDVDVERTLGLVAVRVHPWVDVQHATPIADMAQAQAVGIRKYPGADFGLPATVILTREDFFAFKSNHNQQDFYGRRWFGAGFTGLMDVNTILEGDGLPPLVIADRFCSGWPVGYALAVGVQQGGTSICQDAFWAGPWTKFLDRLATDPRVLLRVG